MELEQEEECPTIAEGKHGQNSTWGEGIALHNCRSPNSTLEVSHYLNFSSCLKLKLFHGAQSFWGPLVSMVDGKQLAFFIFLCFGDSLTGFA